ncbi:MAG: VIT domain-containing protein [Ferruginibacter sp.]
MQKLIILLVTGILLHYHARSQQKLFDRSIQLKNCKISINANAFVASTDIELEFYNNNDKEVEGKQYFFLDRGQVVTGFELELNGKFREGSIEERRKASNTYNSIVGKRIDPAILQMNNQDQYTLNIYPVPAHGSRKVRIKILQLMKVEAQGVSYRLPLNFPGRTDLFVLDVNTCSDGLYPVANNGLLEEKLFIQGRSQGSMHVRDTGLELNKAIAFSLLTVTKMQQLFVANVNEQKNIVKYSPPELSKINIEEIRSLQDAVVCDEQVYNQVLLLRSYDSIMYRSEFSWNSRLVFGLLNKVVTTQTSYIVLERIEDYINYRIEPPKELQQQCAEMNYVYNNESLIRAIMQEEKMPSLAYVVENYNDKIYWWDKKMPLIDLRKPIANITTQDAKASLSSVKNTGETTSADSGPGNSKQELTAVVVTGYGEIARKRSLGYASSIVRGRELTTTNTVNMVDALAGKVSGITIQSSSRPLSGAMITLRGIRSLNGNNQPLLIVNGMHTGLEQFNYINPNDITDINILKSSASAAVFGSEGINGAIIVTTKKGLSRYRPWAEYKLSQQADVEYMEEIKKSDKSNLWETYKELEKSYSDEKGFYLDMADHFFGKKLENEAMIILQLAAQRFRGSVPAKKVIAYTLESWKKFDEAIAIYKAIIQANSFDLGTKKDLALAFYQQGEYQQALNMYYNIIISEPQYGYYYFENAGIKAAAMDEMNALIATHSNEINLSSINMNLIRPLPVDLSISVETVNGVHNFQVIEPSGEACNYSNNVTVSGGYFCKVNGYYYGEDVCQYTIKEAAKGKYRIKVNANDNYYYRDNENNVPKMYRVIVFKNFQRKDQSIEIKNIIMDNQYGVVEIDEVSW